MKSTIAHDRLQGPGEPVVLIHGIGHRREAWGDVPRLLHERGHDVVVVDLPGFGRSPAPERPDGWSMRSTAEQLERLFRDLGIRRPHVVGNSLGGYLALLLASRGTVRTATALSPAGFFPPHHLVLVTGPQLLFMKIGSHLPTALHRWLNGTPARRKLVMGALYRYPEKITTEDAVGDTLNLRRSPGFWPHFVRAIPLRFRARPRVPTTIAWGDHDRLLLPSEARLKDAVPVGMQRTKLLHERLVSIHMLQKSTQLVNTAATVYTKGLALVLIKLFGWGTAHGLKLGAAERGHARQAEMREARQAQGEPEDGGYVDILAVGKVHPLQVGISLDQRIYRAIGELCHTHESDAPQLGQLRREDHDAFVGELDTAC